jgi:acyl-[acyl-carrier-protein] desaturase
VRDYASIIEHLIGAWRIRDRSVAGEAARAQDEICRQAVRYERLADRLSSTLDKQPPVAFSWIQDRRV